MSYPTSYRQIRDPRPPMKMKEFLAFQHLPCITLQGPSAHIVEPNFDHGYDPSRNRTEKLQPFTISGKELPDPEFACAYAPVKTNRQIDEFQRRPRMTLVLGPSGSGKSCWADLNAHRLPQPFYNSDRITQLLGSPNSAKKRLEAKKIVDEAIKRRIKNGENFSLESVWSGPDRPENMRKALKAGYVINAFLVVTEQPYLNVVRTRVRSERGLHLVPEKRILRHMETFPGNMARLANGFYDVEIYDTSHGEPEPLTFHRRGEIVSLGKLHPLFRNIQMALTPKLRGSTF